MLSTTIELRHAQHHQLAAELAARSGQTLRECGNMLDAEADQMRDYARAETGRACSARAALSRGFLSLCARLRDGHTFEIGIDLETRAVVDPAKLASWAGEASRGHVWAVLLGRGGAELTDPGRGRRFTVIAKGKTWGVQDHDRNVWRKVGPAKMKGSNNRDKAVELMIQLEGQADQAWPPA